MRDAAERDRVSSELGGVLCFEMEAAGDAAGSVILDEIIRGKKVLEETLGRSLAVRRQGSF